MSDRKAGVTPLLLGYEHSSGSDNSDSRARRFGSSGRMWQHYGFELTREASKQRAILLLWVPWFCVGWRSCELRILWTRTIAELLLLYVVACNFHLIWFVGLAQVRFGLRLFCGECSGGGVLVGFILKWYCPRITRRLSAVPSIHKLRELRKRAFICTFLDSSSCLSFFHEAQDQIS